MVPLFAGALGAPIVYVALGIWKSQQALHSLGNMLVGIVAFATAYGFSVVFTGFFVGISSVVERRFGLSAAAAWAVAACWPIACAIAVGWAGGAITGWYTLAMATANFCLYAIVKAADRSTVN